MKRQITAVLALFCAAEATQAQGLMSIGPVFDDGETVRWTGSYQSSLGWDSNPQAGFSSGGGGGGEESDGGSAFWENSLSVSTRRGKPENRFVFDASYANTWYLDAPDGADEFGHNGRMGLSYSRELTRQWSVSNAFYGSYQTDPDFSTGATVNRRTGGRFMWTMICRLPTNGPTSLPP